MASDKKKKEPEFSFIEEKIVSRKKHKIKKFIFSIITTIILGGIFGLAAGVVLCITQKPLNSFFGKGKSIVEISSSDQEDQEDINQTPPDDSDNNQGQPSNQGETDDQEEPNTDTVIIEKIIKADLDDLANIYTEIKKVATQASETMVLVTSITKNEDWFENEIDIHNEGIGLIVGNNDVDLLILINYNQVKDANGLKVSFYNNFSTQGRLQSYDGELNLAIIAVPLEELPKELKDIETATLGESSYLPVGTPIIAVGSPNGNIESMEMGMITSKGSSAYITDHQIDLFHTDINYADQGEGFIINLKGDVIGIITSQLKNDKSKKVSTSIGISSVKQIIESLVNDKNRAYFGVSCSDMTEEVLKERELNNGIVITDVLADSPAFYSGLQIGDIIISMDDSTIISVKNLQNKLSLTNPNDVITITIQRKIKNINEIIELDVTLDTRKL